MYRKRGLFVCFSGVDGSGKTTLAKTLVSLMKKKGISVNYVYNRCIPIISRPMMVMGRWLFLRNKNIFEDYRSYSESKKKAIIKHPILSRVYQYLLLFDYFLQTLFKINVALISGRSIICDRYIYDTIATDLAVDFNYSDNDIKEILERAFFLSPKPDVVFLVDIAEGIAYRRKDDVPSPNYLQDRRRIYLLLAKLCGMTIIDGSKSLRELRSLMQQKVSEWTHEQSRISHRDHK